LYGNFYDKIKMVEYFGSLAALISFICFVFAEKKRVNLIFEQGQSSVRERLNTKVH